MKGKIMKDERRHPFGNSTTIKKFGKMTTKSRLINDKWNET